MVGEVLESEAGGRDMDSDWGSGQATPKYASLAFDYFELKLFEKQLLQELSDLPCPSPLKAGGKSPM